MEGYQIDLSEGRHVWVGERDDSFIVQFKNAEGELTHLRLSKDAAGALSYLLGHRIAPADIVHRYIVHIAAATKRDEPPEFEWVEVKTDTAPAPQPAPGSRLLQGIAVS